MNKRLMWFFGFTLSFFANDVFPIIVGSDSLVSRQNFVSFLSTDTDNAIEGFVLLDEGFGLQDSSTEVIYNGAFPVTQNMFLNSGTLYLLRRLHLESMTTFTSLGVIEGNANVLLFPETLEAIGEQNLTQGVLNNITIGLTSNITLDAVLTFSGESVLDGDSNILSFGTLGKIIVDDGSRLKIKNITLNSISNSNLVCNDDNAEIILNNVVCKIDGDLTFSTGKFNFVNSVVFAGTGTFLYDSPQTSTIESSTIVEITDNLTFNIGQSLISGVQPFYFVDPTASFLFDNCYIYVRYPGVNFLRGTLLIDQQITLDMASTASANGIILGDGVDSNNDMRVYYSPGAITYYNTGCLTYNNVDPNRISSVSRTARIIRDVGANTYIAKNWNLSNITSELPSYGVSSLQFAPGVTFAFNNVDIQFPDTLFTLNGSITGPTAFLLTGNQELSITKGTFLLGIIVSGVQNALQGSGILNGPIILAGPTAQLIWSSLARVQQNITLNGGYFQLNNNLALGTNIRINGPGIINFGNKFISINSDGLAWNTPLSLSGSGGGMFLNANLQLSNTLTCTGTVVIEGQGRDLDLGTNGSIIVGPYSQVTLQNVCIKGVSRDRIRCVDDTGTIKLQNATWVLDDLYTFSYGKFNCINDVTFVGTGTFNYDSSATSTLAANSNLKIMNGATFQLGKSGGSIHQPFYFTNSTSQLFLDNCYFLINFPAFAVTRGTIFLNRNITVDMTVSTTSDGMFIGDGINADNDATIYYSPGAVSTYNSGCLIHNNVNPNKFMSASNASKIVRKPGANMYIATDWNLTTITSEVSSNAVSPLQFAPGAELSFDDVTIVFPDIRFNVTGLMSSSSLIVYLTGDDSLSLSKGTYPLGLVVSGQNNSIIGNGKVSGAIILADSTAELTWDALGLIEYSPTLNGGSLILSKNLKLAPRVSITGPGILDVGASIVSADMRDSTWSTPLTINGAQGGVKLVSNMVLSNVWTCTGNVRINGGNHSLDLSTTGALVVAPGSTLNLQNMILKNVSGINIACEDDTAEIILQNVQIEAVDNIQFPYGSLVFSKKNKMKGAHIFAYQSAQTSTINTQSSLIFDTNFTFSYYPTSYQPNLLHFADDTSELILHNASLVTTFSGMNLSAGTLTVRGLCSIGSDIGSTIGQDEEIIAVNNGISFGDGASATNDMLCVITNGSQLTIPSGKLVYQNIESTSFIMQNNLSSLYFTPGTTLQLATSLNTGVGRVIFGDGCLLIRNTGTDLFGSTIPLGVLYRSGME